MVATWALFSRGGAPSYPLSYGQPIISIKATLRHLGVSTATIVTHYTPDSWARLGRGHGVVVQRDGRQEFTGPITQRQVLWDAESGRYLINLQCAGDEQVLADRLAFPDPLRAPDDQTVNDYWSTTATTSAAMLKLISDGAGPTCRADRRVPSLTVGPDSGTGPIRKYQALFTPLMDALASFSVSSGTNLGVRVRPGLGGGLVASLYQPRDLTTSVRFSAGMHNLVGFTYTETAPTVTDPVAAGQGDLHARLRRTATSTADGVGDWGRRIFTYIDRRDTADVADLDQAVVDANAEGVPSVALALNLTDSQAATYGEDWGLGDKVTVHVGIPGQANVATVTDVVREVYLEVDETGAETIRPAVGTDDAKAIIPAPTQATLAKIGRRLSGLETRGS